MTSILYRRARSGRWLAGAAALVALAATPKLAFACWTLCTQVFGYEFAANGTYYQLVSCTQTWPDGASRPYTVCYYTNIGPDGL